MTLEKTMVTVRGFREDDRSAVIELWGRCGLTVAWNDPGRDIDRKLEDSPDLFFVAVENDRPVGTCMAGYDGHRGWIYYLAVHPDHRYRGIACGLVRHAEQTLADRGCPKINLMVRDTNTPVQAFYRKLGYRKDAVTVLSRRLVRDSGDN